MVLQPASNNSSSSSSSSSSSDDDDITSTEQSMTISTIKTIETSVKSTQMETERQNWKNTQSMNKTEISYNVDSSINSKDLLLTVMSANPSFNNESKQIDESK